MAVGVCVYVEVYVLWRWFVVVEGGRDGYLSIYRSGEREIYIYPSIYRRVYRDVYSASKERPGRRREDYRGRGSKTLKGKTSDSRRGGGSAEAPDTASV